MRISIAQPLLVLALAVATMGCSLTESSSGLVGDGGSADAIIGADDGGTQLTPDGSAIDSSLGDGGAPGCASDTDPHNCGACGHDCLGGTCAGGKCGAFPLANGLTRPGYLALDDSYLYWARDAADGGLIERVPLVGGPVEAVSDPQPSTSRLVLQDPYVFYTSGTTVKRRRKDRTDAEKIIFHYPASDFVIQGADANFLVGGSNGSGSLWGGPSDGSSPEFLLYYGVHYGDALAIVGSDVLIGQATGPDLLRHSRSDPDGGISSFASGAARFIVTDATNAYWTVADQASVFMAPKAAGAAPQILAIGPDAAHDGALAIDATHVYWSAQSDSGSIVRASLSGGTTQVVATDVRNGLGVAVDDKRVCWSERDMGKVWCLAK